MVSAHTKNTYTNKTVRLHNLLNLHYVQKELDPAPAAGTATGRKAVGGGTNDADTEVDDDGRDSGEVEEDLAMVRLLQEMEMQEEAIRLQGLQLKLAELPQCTQAHLQQAATEREQQAGADSDEEEEPSDNDQMGQEGPSEGAQDDQSDASGRCTTFWRMRTR